MNFFGVSNEHECITRSLLVLQ